MSEVQLYNFDVESIGNVSLPRFNAMQFGVLALRFPTDYNERITHLQQPQRVTQRISCGVDKPFEFTEERTPIKFTSGFIHTADLLIDETICVQHNSVLLDSPLNDYGVFDFLELASFFTGRRVVTDDNMERYYTDIQKRNNGCYLPLDALNDAWKNRSLLTDTGLNIALLILNSVRSTNLQSLVYHYASVMDIIQTQMFTQGDYIDICKADRKRLKVDIEVLLDNYIFNELDSMNIVHLKEAYKRILASRIDQGAYGPQEQLVSALQTTGVLDGVPSEETRKSVRVINLIRNKVVHTGKLPKLSESDSVLFGGMQEVTMIVGTIMQDFCVVALCHAMKVPIPHYEYYLNRLKLFFRENRFGKWNMEGLFPPSNE